MSRFAGASVALLGVGLLLVDLAMLAFFRPFIVIPIALLPLALVGGLLIARIPRNPVGWLLGLAGLIFAVLFATGAYGWSALVAHPGSPPGVSSPRSSRLLRSRWRSACWCFSCCSSPPGGASAVRGLGSSAE